MTNNVDIIKWFLTQKNLEYKVSKFDWVNEWIPGLKDFKLTIKSNKNLYIGRGIDLNENIAFSKAISECLERMQFRNFQKFNFSGYAAHFNKFNADINSKLELIERDKLFCHFLTKSPFYKIHQPYIDKIVFNGTSIKVIIKKLESQGVKLKVFELKRSKGLFTTICLGIGEKSSPRFGVTIGLGNDLTLEKSIRKSFIECLVNTIYVASHAEVECLTLESFMKIENPGPEDHLKLSMHHDSYEMVKDFIENAISIEESFNGYDIDVFDSIKIVQTRSQHFDSCPLFFSMAHHDHIQKSFWGIPQEQSLNFKRLTNFSGREININNISKNPILIG